MRFQSAALYVLSALCICAGACNDSTSPLRCASLPSVSGWTNLGPAGMWIRTVAVTPAGLLVGTMSAGVLRYNSCNGSWDALGLAGRSITSITTLPSNRLLVTATVAGDTVSAVLYASDDLGSTWYPRDGGLSALRGYLGYAYSLAFDSSDVDRLYLGLPNAVERSLDGGATWTTVAGDPLGAGGGVRCLAVSPPVPSRVWACGGTSGGLPSLLRSDDRGDTWTQLIPTPYDGDAVLALAPDPLAQDGLYAGMVSGLWETEDAGVTWRLVLYPRFPGPITSLAMTGGRLTAVSDELVVGAVAITNVMGLYTSSDQGTTWDTLPTPPTATGATTMTVSASRIAFIGTRYGLWAAPL